ncbi:MULTISPECIES: HNH endonuclease signature motif containing protein [unclassified Pseudoalteromonas]|uniref:HNH endonuclease n=1 Tax=unclassified Pseudoalteromonas TaxID=194690 RepID=UPI00257CBBA5|nr:MULTISPECIES: HNH endonuclease signature motif containing protein [unclassified Pseudoalteromonas]|tara:strand:+ start:4247 stop:5164 length:918 start_codon:yes stop_codon:yes gene_type:complete
MSDTKRSDLSKLKKTKRTPDLSQREAARKWLEANPKVYKLVLEIIDFCDQYRVEGVEFGWFNRESSHVFKYGKDSVGSRLSIRCKQIGCTITVTLPQSENIPKSIQNLFVEEDNELKHRILFEADLDNQSKYDELLNIIKTNVIAPLSNNDKFEQEEPEKYINEFINNIDRLSNTTDTERDALVKVRIGQGKYRSALDKIWNNSCALTGIKCRDLLRASHIKAWRDAEAHERIDPFNGLLLAAHLDALFDKGWISFDSNGFILISGLISESDLNKLSIDKSMRLNMPPETHEYMKCHRRKYKFAC